MAFVRYTLRQLEAFVVVAELRSFTAAAARLGLTNQATSQLVAELESALALRLLDRTTRSVALSSAGRDLLASVQTVLRHAHAAERAAEDVRLRAAGLVRVGAPLVLAGTAIPAAVHAYTADRPRIVVQIKDIPVEGLVDAVAAGDVDLAVGPDRASGTEVLSQRLFESPWVLFCAARHPLAARRTVRWKDLGGVPLVAAGRDHEVGVAPMRPRASAPVEIVDNISTALGIAAAGLAATLSPAYVGVWAGERWGLVMRRVTSPEVVRHVCLYRPLRRVTSPAAEGFAEALEQWMKAEGPRFTPSKNG